MKDPVKCTQWSLFFLRLVVGFIFVFHGFQKFALWGDVGSSMAPNMLLLMKVTSVIEFVAGLALMLGIWARLAAAALALVMIGSIYFLQFVMNVGFSTASGAGWEYNLVLLASLLCLKFGGPGIFALKVLCCKDKTADQKSA